MIRHSDHIGLVDGLNKQNCGWEPRPMDKLGFIPFSCFEDEFNQPEDMRQSGWQNTVLSSCNSIKTFGLFTFYTTITHSKLKGSFIKRMANVYINNLCQEGTDFIQNTTLILPKRSLKLISSTCASFWLTIYLLCLIDVFFNRMSTYLWVLTVLLYSPICSLIRLRQTS